MGLGFLLLILLVGGVVVMGGFVLASVLSPDARAMRERVREAELETAQAKARERIGTKALRAIANGAGNPVFEAQDALDNMESTHTKELN